MNIYEENWVVGEHGEDGRPMELVERERRRAVPLGCQENQCSLGTAIPDSFELV